VRAQKPNARTRAGGNGAVEHKPERLGAADVAAEDSVLNLRSVGKLLDRGRRQGYLTIDEVNEEFAGGGLDAPAIDNLKTAFCEHGVRIVPKSTAGRPRAIKKSNGRSDDDGPTNDPVRVYLREMGQVSLLTREGEVEIAKRIESAIHEKQHAALGTPFGVRQVMQIAERLKKNEVELKWVLDGTDDPEAPQTPEERRRDFFNKITRIRRLDSEVSKKLASIANSRTGEETRQRLRAEASEIYAQMLEQLRATRFAKLRIQELTQALRDVGNRIQELQARGRRLTFAYRVGPDAFRRLATLSTRRSLKAKEALARLGGDPERIAGTLEKLDDLERAIKKIEAEVKMPREEISLSLDHLAEASERALHAKSELVEAVPGSDPGGQHRPDEGRGQVRVPAGLQVLHLRDLVDPPGHHPGDRGSGAHHPHPGAHDRNDQQAGAGDAIPGSDARPGAHPGRALGEDGVPGRQGADGAQDRKGAHLARVSGGRGG
jgi:RNA polymerase primary sigma factor